MWYLAELLFAEPPQSDRVDCQCESCNVVFDAADAAGAYRKAVAWGLSYAAEPPAGMRFLGVAHLSSVGEALTDGTEICGQLFQTPSAWERVNELIPPPEQLAAIRWEREGDTPLGELLSPEQLHQLKGAWRAWGYDAEPGVARDRPRD